LTAAAIISVGIDDTDRLEGGCTTHLTGIFLLKLLREKPGLKLADYPLLVRLNPAIPWKTRGNAATGLRLLCDCDPVEIAEIGWQLVEEYTGGEAREPKGPGIVVYEGEPWRDGALRLLYEKALTDVVAIDTVRRLVEKRGIVARGGMGVVGALAALAALAPGDDYTYELVFYRDPSMIGRERCIDKDMALEVEASTPPCVFNNFDLEEGEVTAAPGGYDPVLAGFRGDCPGPLFEYRRVLCEEPLFWVMFRSNQHTDQHAAPLTPRLTPYSTGKARALVKGPPSILPGGHVIVPADVGGATVSLAFYRETGPLNKAARLLREGDEVVVLGSVKPHPRGVTISVEKMWVDSVSEEALEASPRCPNCGTRMEKKGRGKGFRCRNCGYRLGSRSRMRRARIMGPGEYTPKPGRLPHLVKPSWRSPKRLQGLPIILDPWSVIGR
jgi:tRNA(Ile2)-agmatinylcytidine synthase